jgi:hypothetical protein
MHVVSFFGNSTPTAYRFVVSAHLYVPICQFSSPNLTFVRTHVTLSSLIITAVISINNDNNSKGFIIVIVLCDSTEHSELENKNKIPHRSEPTVKILNAYFACESTIKIPV